MVGHQIKNQYALHYLTLTVVGWVDVFTRDSYRQLVVDSLVYCQEHKGLHKKLNYLNLNPVRNNLVTKAEYYRYSSASNYVYGTGVLEVEIIDLGLGIGYVNVG